MNRFSHLDAIFPCGKDRKFGEVVSVRIELIDCSLPSPTFLSWKRKAWYVNASVNAFHMHRGICREIRNIPGLLITTAELRKLFRLVGDCIDHAYKANALSGVQETFFILRRSHLTS